MGYQDEAQAQMTRRYALFGPQVFFLLVFFIKITSILIVYRFHLTTTRPPQQIHPHLHLPTNTP